MTKLVFEPGVHQISNDDYHASAGISRSGIMELQKSPLNYWDKYLSPEKEDSDRTNSMVLGQALHTSILEPSLFNKIFAVQPKIDGRTTIGKQQKALFEQLSLGKTIISESDYLLSNKMANAVLNHEESLKILNNAKVEQSIFWVDEESGVTCKARPDIWNNELLMLADLKTTSDPSEAAFRYSSKQYGYHIQAAMQIDGIFSRTGIMINHFAFIVIPNKRPHMPYIYWLEPDDIAFGRSEYKLALKIFKACEQKNCWDKDRHMLTPFRIFNYQPQSSFSHLQEIYNV